MTRRIFILFTFITTLLGFKPREDTWEERWARHRVRPRDDYRWFYRATVPGYAEEEDDYHIFLKLHAMGKISDDCLAKLGGECLRRMHVMEEEAWQRAWDFHNRQISRTFLSSEYKYVENLGGKCWKYTLTVEDGESVVLYRFEQIPEDEARKLLFGELQKVKALRA